MILFYLFFLIACYYLAKHHGTNGYLTVTDVVHRVPLSLAFMASAADLGYPIRDVNGQEQTGTVVQVNSDSLLFTIDELY